MSGWVKKAAEEMVFAARASAVRLEIERRSGVKEEILISDEAYPGEITDRLVAAAAPGSPKWTKSSACLGAPCRCGHAGRGLVDCLGFARPSCCECGCAAHCGGRRGVRGRCPGLAFIPVRISSTTHRPSGKIDYNYSLTAG
jgi:hypothetical protein